MKKINNFDKLLIICISLSLVLNPLTGQYILWGINYVLDMAMLFGPLVISAPIAYVIGYLVVKIHQSNKIKLPTKGK